MAKVITMCSNYEALRKWEHYDKYFDVALPSTQGKLEMWPKYEGSFVRKPPETDPYDEAVPAPEALTGRWGLVPWMLKPENAPKQLKLSTFNARIESVAKSFTYGGAWKRSQQCIVPADAFYEPDWRSGKAVRTRFTRADGLPMGIAGLWDVWNDPVKGQLLSFTMLTVNADDHPLLRNFHRPGEEKRMIVVLPENRYADWLNAPPNDSINFMLPYPSDNLVAVPVPPKPKATEPELI